MGYQSITRLPPPTFHKPSLTIFWHPFILLDVERHCKSGLFCPKTQHIVPVRSWTHTSQPGVQCANYWAKLAYLIGQNIQCKSFSDAQFSSIGSFHSRGCHKYIVIKFTLYHQIDAFSSRKVMIRGIKNCQLLDNCCLT